MYKLVITLVVLILLLFGTLSLIPGVSPGNVYGSVQVGTHIGAKLACSGHFISGFSPEQVKENIASYSPILKRLTINYNDRQSEVSFYGVAKASATYRPGLGCTLDHDDGARLHNVQVPSLESGDSPWPAGNQVVTIDPAIQAKLDALLKKEVEAGLNPRALLLVKDGSIAAESYAPGFAADTPLLGWSMAKSVTAMMLGHLEMTGRQPKAPLFSNWQDQRKEITLDDMLHMSSGLNWQETYVPGTDSTQMLFLEPVASDYASRAAYQYQPGTHFQYSSGTTNMLSRLVFDLAGGSAQANVDYFYNEFAKSIGLTNTVFEVDSLGAFIGSSYLYASARDWARLGWLMVNGGSINDTRMLSKDWIEKATSPNTSENDQRYGYQFWLNGEDKRWPSLPASAYGMQGNRAQAVLMFPEEKLVIVRLGWTAGRYPMDENFGEIYRWFEG